jgi:uncharacterized membrane protein YfcA
MRWVGPARSARMRRAPRLPPGPVPGCRATLGAAAITALAGLVLLAWTLGIVEASVFALLWPLVLVVVGLRLLLTRNSVPRGRSEDDTVSAAVLFSGRELTSFSHRFAGGSLFAAFGGIDLDLTNARPQPGGATIMVTALFGGAEVKLGATMPVARVEP